MYIYIYISCIYIYIYTHTSCISLCVIRLGALLQKDRADIGWGTCSALFAGGSQVLIWSIFAPACCEPRRLAMLACSAAHPKNSRGKKMEKESLSSTARFIMHRTNQNEFFILVSTYAMPAQNMLRSHPYCNDLPEFTKHSQNYMFSIPEKHKLTRFYIFYGFFWWLHPLMSPSAPCTKALKALGRVFPTASLRSLIAFSVRLT